MNKLSKTNTIHQYLQVMEQCIADMFNDGNQTLIHVVLLDPEVTLAFSLEEDTQTSFTNLKIESSV